MKRWMVPMFSAAGLFMLGACAETPKPTFEPALAVDPAATLLFDPAPSVYSPESYAFRSQWPRTPGFSSQGEVVSYRERFYDHQGDPFRFRDYFVRRFTSVRRGVRYR